MTTSTKLRRPAMRPAIDYPERGNIITSREYTVRVSAPEDARAVEVSVDGGPWLACRQAAGFWWYDWASYSDGPHDMAVRCRRAEDMIVLGVKRDCLVDLDGHAPAGVEGKAERGGRVRNAR